MTRQKSSPEFDDDELSGRLEQPTIPAPASLEPRAPTSAIFPRPPAIPAEAKYLRREVLSVFHNDGEEFAPETVREGGMLSEIPSEIISVSRTLKELNMSRFTAESESAEYFVQEVFPKMYRYEWWKSDNALEVVWGILDTSILIFDQQVYQALVAKLVGSEMAEILVNSSGQLKRELAKKHDPNYLQSIVVKRDQK